MSYHYSVKAQEHQACAVGTSLAISPKHSAEVCKSVRGKTVHYARRLLERVVSLSAPVPYTKYHFDLAHKAGMGPGRYPVSTCKAILQVLKNAEANAQNKGLATGSLVIHHISAQIGPRVWRYGRHGRRRAKRTHIELVVEERRKHD